jgi:tight adherence protein B
MRHRRLASIAAAAVMAVLASAAPTAAQSADELEIAPVTRLPFPERGYVVSLRSGASIDGSAIEVRENGMRVANSLVTPLAASGLRFGVVLAIDASNSMEGPPFEAAINAAKRFVSERQPEAELGFVAFNGDVLVLQTPTDDTDALARALENPPVLAYGTRIYDALDRSLDLLADSKIAAGSVVLLSDGADVGSVHRLDRIVAAARRQRVRIFTVGLRSGAFDPSALRGIAERTGGTYAEASSADELAAIYSELGRRLAGEYLIRYRSNARPESHVDVEIALSGIAGATAEYVAPTPAGVAPYHRPLITRFVLSPASVALVALLATVLLGWAIALLAKGRTRDLVERVSHFSVEAPRVLRERDLAAAIPARVGGQYTKGWWARLERDLEIARIEMSPRRVAAFTGSGSLGLFVVVFAAVSPIFAVLGLIAPPIASRSIVRWKLARLRDTFADQLPTALQVLASALRAGHSFSGALGVVVENTHEPARSELKRVVQDDQLGVMPEVALRRMAERMANRDIEQVALLAELQRTSGGNSAEVLDTVVETIRERGELRRLVKTLTAQGRMARWILTGLPIVLTLFLWFMNPDVMNPFFESGVGQALVLVAVIMVAAGSALIQRIIDIDV